MEYLKELEAAFIKADDASRAGDERAAKDAQAFATEIKRLRAAGASRPLPANAGVADLAASVVGMPMDFVQNVANLGIAAYGTAKGAITGDPGASPEPIKNIPGGSENVRQMLRATGAPALNPDNPAPGSKMGTAQYEFVRRGGAVPGGALAAAASMAAEAVGGPEWAGVGALAPNAAITAYNQARAPALAQAKAQNTVRDQTLREAQDAGYSLPASQVHSTVANTSLESFAGKAALKQAHELKNQHVTNRLVRDELGMATDAPITEAALNQLRNAAAEPYRKVAASSRSSQMALELLRDTRSAAKDQWRHWDIQGVPEAKRQAQLLDKKAERLERFLERQARMAGQPDLVNELRDARTYIAKTFDVERALNIGNGNVDAKIIGRLMDRGRPLTGNLAVIAKFAEGPGRQFTRESSAVPTPNVSALNWPAAAILGVEGAQYFGPHGAAMAAIPFARGGVREGLISDVYQRNFARPSYDPAVQPTGDLQALVQSVIAQQQAGRR